METQCSLHCLTFADFIGVSLALIAIITAFFIFALPFLEHPSTIPFIVDFKILSLSISLEWKKTVGYFVVLTLVTDLFLFMYFQYSVQVFYDLGSIFMIITVLFFVLLLISAFTGLPATIKRIEEFKNWQRERKNIVENQH